MEEKNGGAYRAESTFGDFRTFMAEGDLYDVKHTGDPLSWRGVRINQIVVRCRLDRAVANSLWHERFPASVCAYLRYEGSDHKPIITHLDLSRKKKRGLFRYDRNLNGNLEVKDLIKAEWERDVDDSVERRINRVRSAMIKWNRDKFQKKSLVLEDKKRCLEEALTKPLQDEVLIKRLKVDLAKLYAEEEGFWRQRSRLLWLNLGDKNSSYFHAITKGRNARNNIPVIENDDGLPFYKEEDIVSTISDYFLNIFTSHSDDCRSIVQEALERKISDEENVKLIEEPSEDEVREALFNIHPDKAPGPDGFSASFFQANWDIIRVEFVEETQEFFRSDSFPTSLNKTHVRLIPKVACPRKVSDYRPIALCNVFYKVISKILSKRIQPLLGKLISENQSAFVPKRAISDNVLITHEVLHYLKTSKADKYCSMAVKTDMSKAYDRIEWNFIGEVFRQLGFCEKWVKWILACVSTVDYSFLLNGSNHGQVLPQRGIRQGDPLSPYIFILCSEVLSGLCAKAQANGSLQGLKVAHGSPRINHLLFADDTMFFCKTNPKSLKTLKKIILKYEKASGQSINKDKSSISFSRKTPEAIRSLVKAELDISKEGGVGKYLGLPEHFGRKKKDLFTSIVDRISQKAASWATKFLSAAGKMVMLKSVLSAIPTYAMSCFLLPSSLCNRIQSALTRFWWDSNPDKRGMCWVAWDQLILPKKEGGLGFRDIHAFNVAMLAKISWRVQNEPECLLARVLRGKYFPETNFLDVLAPKSSSHGWTGILAGRDLLKKNLGWAIGDGETSRIWSDNWLGSDTRCGPFGPPRKDLQLLPVSLLFEQGGTKWNKASIRELLPLEEETILAIKPSKTCAPDRLIWCKEKSGIYSAKSGYYEAILANHGSPLATRGPIKWISDVWELKIPPKLKLFVWKLFRKALATGENLATRGLGGNVRCGRCGEFESTAHIFWECSFAKEVWNLAPIFGSRDLFQESIFEVAWPRLVKRVCLPPTGVAGGVIAAWVIWNLWISRNHGIFKGLLVSSRVLVNKVIIGAKEWFLAQEREGRSKSQIKYKQPKRLGGIVMWVDASWIEISLVAGLACIVKDGDATIITKSAVETEVVSALVGEGLALRLAMELAIQEGFLSVTFRSDCLQLIKLVEGSISIASLYGIVADIKTLSCTFDHFDVVFTPRSLNGEADALAKQVSRSFVVNQHF